MAELWLRKNQVVEVIYTIEFNSFVIVCMYSMLPLGEGKIMLVGMFLSVRMTGSLIANFFSAVQK